MTRFVSKSLLPVYDTPVFRFGLESLRCATCIDEILILTNDDNDAALARAGFPTLVQDDASVHDMFSGWEFIKRRTGTAKDAVLMPSDNVSNVDVDALVRAMQEEHADIAFSLFEVGEREKLSQMGCYDLVKKKFYYKHPDPPTTFGVIAPYIVRNSFPTGAGDTVLDHQPSCQRVHRGYWFDVGDPESLASASQWRRRHVVSLSSISE